MKIKFFAVAFLLGLTCFAIWNVFTHQKPAIGISEGNEAPDFTLQTLDGKAVSLSDYKGKKVFLNFWATWCKPCIEEMPDLETLQNKSEEEVAVLAVNFTSSEKNSAAVRNFAEKHNITFPVLLDEKGINARYEIISYPTTFLINEEGIITEIKLGSMTLKEMEQKLSDL
ncbi:MULTISPECIES: redoxin family protein [Bacillus]|uniref:Thiol:disulfide interchange protein n=2 Tax=Bacillus TaxID=1386 RepID=A0A0M5JGA5_9BACI|nr:MULTISPECIES: redoxin family protein [Bacillus]ALC81164.1 thiol:disulfide interchange protein [Bacillus gobiensis]MBP1080138.1 peroxiredoxin [Bacillus capparidis]MED1095522.1 redoxin family protein [Bacillus capparidis]